MKQSIAAKEARNAEELLEVIAFAQSLTGDHLSTIYLTDPLLLTLIEETLTDGSTVRNLKIEQLRSTGR